MESSLMKTNQHLMNRFALCIKKTTPYWKWFLIVLLLDFHTIPERHEVVVCVTKLDED